MKLIHKTILIAAAAFTVCACASDPKPEPVDYVNPYIGNISHLLVPTYPTIQLPNSMLRVYPERSDYTSELVNGLPIIVTNHRERSAFNLTPFQGESLRPVVRYNYDQEVITPYSYAVELDDNKIGVKYALSHQSAIYEIAFEKDKPAYIIVNTRSGSISVSNEAISGWQQLPNNVKVYVYMEPSVAPVAAGIVRDGRIEASDTAEGRNAAAAWKFADGTAAVALRYGVSFISEEQAKANLYREISDFNVGKLAEQGRKVWNEALGRIKVEGGTEEEKTVFYTSFYRTFERPVCMSEDGRYFSAFDGTVHEDEGHPFYTDDWIWDTYRAAHPLRILINRGTEEDILCSYLRMAEQMGNMWMPTFPETTGDTRRMNSNHAVASFADAFYKGVDADYEKAFIAARKGMEEKTLIPWSGAPAGWLDEFYAANGYIPALREGEVETVENVNPFERRQSVAVTLGTSYDQWCLSRLAAGLDKEAEAAHYLECAHNYRNLFNPETCFFHPKDKDGNWIEPFDYRYSGGIGARNYYDENNGWVYRWDVQHNVADLIAMMGGSEAFIKNLDSMFAEPLGRGKSSFYAQFPDHTGNVGQFSMANEPSLHIPYLYNYAGAPWKTQKRVRQMLKTWFRNDLMGVPGDEDGGGLTSFVVFSSTGIYPVTPGYPAYNIGSPVFSNVKFDLGGGKVFEIVAKGASDTNKYIQSATLNGKVWDKPWVSHEDVAAGGKLVLVMGPEPNTSWGADPSCAPFSTD